MALLYYISLSKPENVAPVPPSLNEWYNNTLIPNLQKNPVTIGSSGSIELIFANQTDLNAFVNTIKLTTAQQAEFDEWKSAQGITISHTVHELPSSDIVVNPF